MKVKRLSTLSVALLSIMSCFAGNSLLVHLTDGTEIVCSLAKEPQMSFGEKTITLSSLVGEVGQWDFNNVESWEFVDRMDQDEVDAVDKPKADKPQIKIKEGQVTIAGNNAKDAAIYDANGRIMYKAQGSKINLNGLAKGTYLLKVGESCVKFSVRK